MQLKPLNRVSISAVNYGSFTVMKTGRLRVATARLQQGLWSFEASTRARDALLGLPVKDRDWVAMDEQYRVKSS